MGDSNRFLVFAKFIARNYKPCKVADVAGGIGLVSHYLNEIGFHSTVIDPRKIKPSNQYPLSHYQFSQIPRIRSLFSENMEEDYDLIVGLHPDEATEVIIQSAIHKHIAVVPCCHFWNGIESHGSPDMKTTICRFLQRHNLHYSITTLPMSGKNIVIWT